MRPARIVALALALALGGCPRAEPAAEQAAPSAEGTKAHVDEPAHAEPPRRIRLTPEVERDAGIEWAPVTRDRIRPTLALFGHVIVDPDRSSRVAALLAGTIDRVMVTIGDAVKPGDAIATIRAPNLGEIRSAVASLEARAASARANAERLRTLVPKRLGSEQEAVTAEAEADALEAEVAAAKQRLRAFGLGQRGRTPDFTVHSHSTGFVVARPAVVGSPVVPETILVEIANLDEVWFSAHVFEKDTARIRVGADAEVELNAYPGEYFSGRITYLAHRVDPQSATLTARIPLPNPDGKLRLGLYGTAEVALETPAEREPTLVVPRSAVVELDARTVVFVRHPDGDYEVHEVVLGDHDPGRVEVLHGLREGEEVVTRGAFNIESALLRGSLVEED